MKISALIPNLATNCIVRSWPILKVLERQHEVEVIGSLMGDEELFPPYANEFAYKIVRWDKPGKILRHLRQLREQISGDVVYAFKPLTASFAAGLWEKFRGRRPVILDIEDWEAWGLYKNQSRFKHHLHVTHQLLGPGWGMPHSGKYRYLMEHCTPLADAKTVVSRFLQHRYGGTILRHGPDTSIFDPTRYTGHLREKWKIDSHLRLILFAGTPGRHKGLENLLAALEQVSLHDVRLLMVGKGEPPADARHNVLHLGFQPHELMPELLALADLVVLPQKRHPVAEAQIPAKVFEAMAMAKPVIASAISDLPEILDGCGIVVEPENVPALATAIQDVLTDRQQAQELGRRARDKCIQEYSWDAMGRVLDTVLRPFG